MEKKQYEFKASSVEAATQSGLEALGLSAEEADIEVVSAGGFFSKAIVRVSPKGEGTIAEDVEEEIVPTYDELRAMEQAAASRSGNNNNRDRGERGYDRNGSRNGGNRPRREFDRERSESEERKAAKDYLEKIIAFMPAKARVDSKENKEEIMLFIGGTEASFFIGRRGEFLDALQYIVNHKINGALEDGENKKRVTVDADFYRERRKKSLTAYAVKMARSAVATQKNVHLEAMNSYERRIIHSALQRSDEVETCSEGEGKDRHIVIIPKSDTFTYGNSTDFRKKGPSKTKSFGYNKTVF